MSKQQIQTSVISTSLEAIEKQAAGYVKKLEVIAINSEEEYDKIALNVSKLKEYKKEAEAKQSGIIDPLNLSIKNTRSLFKPFFEKVDRLELAAKTAMLGWVNKRELAAKKVEQDFDTGKIKKVSTVTRKTTELRTNSSANSSLRKVFKLTIVSPSKIPREYLVPNESAIKEAFKNGESVPGCKWEQENTIAI